MTSPSQPPDHDNVYNLFTGQPASAPGSQQIIRLSPELDGLEMLYSNKLNAKKLFAMKILCWALRRNGEVIGLIPWMDKVIPCTEISDPLEGQFQGYFDPGIDEIFFEAPIHKVVELETAAEYYEFESDNPDDVVQEIPDTLGTHAVFSAQDSHNLLLTAIVSWQLRNDGKLHGMVVNEKQCTETPVLPGDPCLYSATASPNFRYYFQHHIANKIKARDPEALAAIAMLVEKEIAPKEKTEKKSADIISVDKNKPR